MKTLTQDDMVQRVLDSLIEDKTLILQNIIYNAADFWVNAGFEDDFCIQLYSDDRIIFGSWNRVSWTIKNGFRAIKSHCTEKFLANNLELEQI